MICYALGHFLKLFYFLIFFSFQFPALAGQNDIFLKELHLNKSMLGGETSSHLVFKSKFGTESLADRLVSTYDNADVHSDSGDDFSESPVNPYHRFGPAPFFRKANLDADIPNISARESIFELGYKAISTKNYSTFWLDGLYHGDLDCSFSICKSSYELEWSAGAKFEFSKFSITGLYKNKKSNDLGFNKFKSGVLRPNASINTFERGGYQVLGKYVVNQDTRFNFSLGDVSAEYDADKNLDVYRSNYQKSLWTVGVHHDVNSWLKIVAEYNRAQYGVRHANEGKEDSISVGGMLRW